MLIKVERKARRAERAGDGLAHEAREAVGRAADRAAETYAAARDVAERVEPFVKDRPFMALALAGIAGLVIGGLFLPPGPKVVYVRPRD
jgi:ElaB/YqjD/DUF883 family membrane-anchored ribosome-binding protein